MMKSLMVMGLVGVLAVGSLARAEVSAMSNQELAATVVAVPQAQLQPAVPESHVNGQIAGVALEALIPQNLPVVQNPSADISASGSGNANQRQLTIQIPVTPALNDQLANISQHNFIIPQSTLR